MLHKVQQLSLGEVNKVLRLIQEKIPSSLDFNRGKSQPVLDLAGQTTAKNNGSINLNTVVTSYGDTATKPIELLVGISLTYPNFGFGSSWGNNWGI